ncbi:MAG: lipoyl(octanoyl) transferase LipB [Bacteroidales bacterium]
MKNLIFEDWGLIPYPEALNRQTNYFNEAIAAKSNNTGVTSRWIFCEHPPVLTTGKHGNRENLLYTQQDLESKNISLYETGRGGDITFHGPGQLVAYPILDLEEARMGLRSYIFFLEEIVIRTLAEYGIRGERVEGASGVWLDKNTSRERKICAVGVKSSRYITMHGLAFNINTDLSYFSLINPCGFIDKGVTSLEQEIGSKQSLEIIREKLCKHVLLLLK